MRWHAQCFQRLAAEEAADNEVRAYEACEVFGNMIANATSSCIQTTAHSPAMVAGNLSRNWMRLIATVCHFHYAFYISILTDCLVCSEGGSGCMKAQESSPDQQPTPMSFKVESDAGGQDSWGYEGGLRV